eukprot:COSAG01_NODE_26180_length_721_cov_2.323151_1_plen_71_part_10
MTQNDNKTIQQVGEALDASEDGIVYRWSVGDEKAVYYQGRKRFEFFTDMDVGVPLLQVNLCQTTARLAVLH